MQAGNCGLSPISPISPCPRFLRFLDFSVCPRFLRLLDLNISVSTVQKWEIGEKKPSGIALKLLNIVECNGMDVLV